MTNSWRLSVNMRGLTESVVEWHVAYNDLRNRWSNGMSLTTTATGVLVWAGSTSSVA